MSNGTSFAALWRDKKKTVIKKKKKTNYKDPRTQNFNSILI